MFPLKKPEQIFSYREAGVNIEAGNELVRSIAPIADLTKRLGTIDRIGGFGGLFDLKAVGYQDPLLVASSDGVGTKVKIAIETGIHDTIGIDLVAMCVNDLIVQGAEPLFLLDYFACGKLDLKVAKCVIGGVIKGCEDAGAQLLGGETAEMPGVYADGDYDLAGFSVGAVERPDVLPRKNLQAGDVLIGLASSGVHSNGFSFIRRLVSDLGLDWDTSSPFQENQTLGESLLTPTRIYVKSVLSVIRKTRAIKALSHITGSAHLEKIPRVLPEKLNASIDVSAWTVPPVFGWIQKHSGASDNEMLKVFNCGIGMVVITSKEDADKVCDAFVEADEKPYVIGELVPHGAGSRETQIKQRLQFTS